MEGSDSESWLALLAESDERLVELDGSPDPVAQREIAEALLAKGKALRELGRLPESIEVWDELVRRFAAEPSDGAQRLVLRALFRKALDLGRLGEEVQAVETADALLALADSLDQTEEVRSKILSALLVKLTTVRSDDREAIAAIDEEIIRRFAYSTDPRAGVYVTTALVRTGLFRLLENEFDGAIQTSLALGERLETCPEETLVAEADLVNDYAHSLAGVTGTDWRGMTEAFAFATVNTATWVRKNLVERLSTFRAIRLVAPLRNTPRAHGIRVTPAHWPESRRRIESAVELLQRVISRIGQDPDPELQRTATVARIQTAQARLVLGNIRQALRELNTLFDSSDPVTVQALQTMTGRLRGRSDLPAQLNELSMLSWRAQVLGQGDSQIQQIAYQDSIEPLVSDTTHRSVRWLAALLKPERGLFTELTARTRAVARVVRRR